MNRKFHLTLAALTAATVINSVLMAAAPAPAAAPGAAAAPAGGPGAARGPGGPGAGRGAPVVLDQPGPSSLNAQKHTAYMAKAKAAADARKANGPGVIDLYLEGDSITDFWENNAANKPNYTQNFGGWNPGDFGIAGERTDHLLFRIKEGELDGVNPKVIVLLIGTNSVQATPAGGSDDAMVDNITKGDIAVIKAMHEKAPAAKIVLMAITTRNQGGGGRGGRGARGAAGGPPATTPASAPATAPATAPAPNPAVVASLMPTINKINAKLEAYVKANDDKTLTIKFLNINDKLADKDGILHPGIMQDGLHPTAQGYQIWADALKPILTDWLGEPKPAAAK